MADDHKVKRPPSSAQGFGRATQAATAMAGQVADSVEQEKLVLDHSECESRLADVEGKYRRALADYQNLERQTREAQMRFAKLATQGFVEELIGPYDNLLRATAHLKDKGLEMVIGQFRQVFESQGLKEINPVDQLFDATTMEAVDTKEGEEGKVLEIMSVGYELNGIVIKHAQVIVGKKDAQ